jgi:3',5'-cyclic AMP phosphodiesterase CpdA
MKKALAAALALVMLGVFSAQADEPVHVVAAGDIATKYAQNGQFGDTLTGNLVRTLNPTQVLAIGDEAYPNGALSDFNNWYKPTWGSFKASTFPVPGNHEYKTAGAAGYKAYYGTTVGGIQSQVIGGWLIVGLDSNVNFTAQTTALKALLAADTNQCELLFWHHPRWGTGTMAGLGKTGPWWLAAYQNHVELVLNGHNHWYERSVPVNNLQQPVADGVTQVVVGTGGIGVKQPQKGFDATSAKFLSMWGVLDLALTPTSYTAEFKDTTGAVQDSFSGTCI